MLSLWEKVENKINELLEKLGTLLKKKLCSLIPEIVFQKRDQFKSKYIDYKDSKKELVKSKIHLFIDKAKETKERIFHRLTELQNYPYKEKLLLIWAAILTFLKTPLRSHLKNIFKRFVALTIRIKIYLRRYEPQQLLATTLAILLAVPASYLLYQSTHTIWLNEYADRSPASVEVYQERPNYYLKKEKTYVVLNIQVPLLVENINQIHNITIDFSVTTSTRFAKLYLMHNEYEVKDYFFTEVGPIMGDFQLSHEGKTILKEKIQYELNRFLKRQNVEGHVTEVKLIYILGT